MKAIKKDFFVEIKRTKSRFLSIMAIVALGVAFYAGIRATEPDMFLSADTMYDNQNMFDLRIMSTLGLTQKDLDEIKAVPGVKQVEGARSMDVLSKRDDAEFVIHMMERTKEIDHVELVEGRDTRSETECLIDHYYFSSHGLKIGDTILVYLPDKKDMSDTLSVTEYTIAGTFRDCNYLTATKGTTSIGTGTISALMMVDSSVFVSDVITTIYVTVDGAKELISYEDEYESLVEVVKKRIEDQVVDSAVVRRYEEVKAEYEDGIASGEVELSDAKKELEDGEKEYNDGLLEYNDGKKQFDDGKAKLEEAQGLLADGRKQLEDGKKELENARTEIETSEIEIAINEQLLLQNELKVEAGELELEKNRVTYDTAKEEMQEAKNQLSLAKLQLDEGKRQYESSRQLVSFLTEVLEVAKSTLKELEDALAKSPQSENVLKQIEEIKKQIATYETQLADAKASLEDAKATLEAGEAAYNENLKLVEEAEQELTDAKVQLDAAEAELTDAKTQLNDAKTQLSDGKSKLLDGKKQLAESQALLSGKEEELEENEAEVTKGLEALAEQEGTLLEAKEALDEARATLDDGWNSYQDGIEKLEDTKKALEKLKIPSWYVLDRNSTQSFVEYGGDARRIGNIGHVFPFIFFIVAALVSLTTMTRMVEEQRTQIGTMKALGYKNSTIASKYLLYALLATLGGSLVGGIIGCKLIPPIIQSAYGLLYHELNIQLTPINWYFYLTASLIAVGCILGATWMACYKEMIAVPAVLMRPVAPKKGHRNLIERLPFLWQRLTFSQKSTVRNLLRYKKRVIMTMFGICGCMALIITGFGVKDSVSDIVAIQFNEIQRYDISMSIDEEKLDSIKDVLSSDVRLKGCQYQYQVNADFVKDGKSSSGSMVVVEHPEHYKEYVSLRHRSDHKEVTIPEEGVIISEKTGNMLGVSVGDMITVKISDTERYEVKVAEITENYIMHYTYMSKGYYETVFGEEYKPNQALLLTTSKMSDEEVDDFCGEYLALDEVKGVSYSSSYSEHFDEMLGSMDAVIVVLVVSAGLLAFIVLFNLNNINITERRRELASLKVLGFYDGEVSMYVFRENLVITILSLFLGSGFGKILHRYIVLTIEMDNIMFGRDIKPMSYVYSILLTLLFAGIINFSMHFKLKKVDMATSLKSAE